MPTYLGTACLYIWATIQKVIYRKCRCEHTYFAGEELIFPSYNKKEIPRIVKVRSLRKLANVCEVPKKTPTKKLSSRIPMESKMRADLEPSAAIPAERSRSDDKRKDRRRRRRSRSRDRRSKDRKRREASRERRRRRSRERRERRPRERDASRERRRRRRERQEEKPAKKDEPSSEQTSLLIEGEKSDGDEFELVQTQSSLIDPENPIDIVVNEFSEPEEENEKPRRTPSPIEYFDSSPKKRKKTPSPIQYFEGSPPKRQKISDSPQTESPGRETGEIKDDIREKTPSPSFERSPERRKRSRSSDRGRRRRSRSRSPYSKRRRRSRSRERRREEEVVGLVEMIDVNDPEVAFVGYTQSSLF